ncbi:MAG TPA: NUDIX domain-containing protein, partial [Polyangiaceae bacterium]
MGPARHGRRDQRWWVDRAHLGAGRPAGDRDGGGEAALKTVVVAAAVMVEGRRVLVTQRKAGTHLAGAWEFPGGKVEAGEDPREALRRELREELG